MARRQQPAVDDAGSRALWFIPPAGDENRRRSLTREQVVAEALTVISTDGVEALSMRALATRLGVVPAALYRHVRNKEQLHDLVLDGVLARHRRATQDPRPPRAALPCPRRGVPRRAAPGWPARTGHRPGLRPGLRLHPRVRAQQLYLRQRAARPRHRDQKQAPRVPAVTAGRKLPHPGRPRRTCLAQQPRRTVHRRPRHPRRRTRRGATPTPAARQPATATPIATDLTGSIAPGRS
jgi:AcrR family transcriptional regulator